MGVLNSMDATLRHFHPYLLPRMIPFSTTDEQAKTPNEWKKETGNGYHVSIRKVNPSEDNLDLIHRWLRTCEEEHTSWCKSKDSPTDTVHVFRVIDVEKGTIVNTPPRCIYLALSYVWGKVHEDNEYLSLKQENYNDLEPPGALFDKTKFLPQTIKNGISICQKLDERCLWVDSLYIIQDSIEDKKNQIGKMDAIYRKALLTIVTAAGSDANAGLPRLRPELPRKPTPTANIQSLDLVALTEDIESELNTSNWNSRAWTFQERVLSTRLLRFASTSVTFECQQAAGAKISS